MNFDVTIFIFSDTSDIIITRFYFDCEFILFLLNESNEYHGAFSINQSCYYDISMETI